MKYMYMLVFIFSVLTENYLVMGYKKNTVQKKTFIGITIVEVIILLVCGYLILTS